MANDCVGIHATKKAPNGEESLLYNKLYMMTRSESTAEELYNYFKTDEFLQVFGDYTEYYDFNEEELSNLKESPFTYRVDDNFEPELFFDDNFNSYYFRDKYGNRTYYPLKNDKLNNYFLTEEINELSQSIAHAYISQFQFDTNKMSFTNPKNIDIRNFVSDFLSSFKIEGNQIDELDAFILEENIKDTLDLYLTEWVQKVTQQLRRKRLNTRTVEDTIQRFEEGAIKNELIRKDSFETDFKEGINNNIKLMLSLIPSNKVNKFGLPVYLPFEEVVTDLMDKLTDIKYDTSKDKFDFLVEEVKKLVKIKPQYEHLIEETKENQYFPLFNVNADRNFKNQIISAFDLAKKNHLQSEVEFEDFQLLFSFKNISETSNRKNIALRTWDINFKNKNYNSSQKNRLKSSKVANLRMFINRTRGNYKTLESFLDKIKPDLYNILDQFGIEYNDKILNYYLNSNSLEELDLQTNIKAVENLLKGLEYFVENETDSFKAQSAIVKFAEANGFFMERTTDASVQTMGKQKWVFGNRTYIETLINEFISNPELLRKKLKNSSSVESGSFYIKYLLGEIDQNGLEMSDSGKKEVSLERLKKLKVYYFNGLQKKKDIKNASDSKNISRSDIILDNINKTLSFKVGLKPTSKTSLASDKSSAIEIEYGMSVDADLKFINGNFEVSNHVQNIVFNYLDAEYRRIYKVYQEIQDLEENELIDNFHNGNKNGLKFFTITGFNKESESGIKLFNSRGKPIYKDLRNSQELIDSVKGYINKAIKEEVNNAKNKLLDNRILKLDTNGNITNNLVTKSIFNTYVKDKGSNAIDSLVTDYVVNSFISQVEYHNLFSGDMAYYKNPVDYIKRVSSAYTDGKYLNNSYENPFFNVAVIDSVEIDPANIDNIPKAMRELYLNSNSADGQAWITPQRWKFIRQGLGKFTPLDEQIYKKLFQEDATFTNEELKRLAQPLKGVHFELKNGIEPVYLKYSQAVLVPSIIKNIPNLKAMYDRMTDSNNPIDELLTQDAIKVGARGSTKIHTEQGNVIDLDKLNTFQLQNKFWKLQQDLPTKGYKDLKLGSQIKEIILQGLANVKKSTKFRIDGDSKEYNNLEMFDIINTVLASKSDLGVQRIKSILSLDNNFEITNSDILYKKIIKQLEERDTDQNSLDALKMGISPYGISGKAEIFQNVFSSLINKEIIDIETNGGSFIQMSDFGFSFDQFTDKVNSNGIVLTPAGKRALENKESKLYMPEVYENEEGKKRVRAGGVFISGSLIAKHIPDYKRFTTEQLFGTYNEDTKTYQGGMIDNKIFESIISYRIPNQGLASNDSLEVLGLLPESMADTIVPYTGFTTKTGSDFDIDKIYLMIPSFRTEYTGKLLNRIKKALRNSLDINEIREELLMQGYNKNDIKKNNTAFDYFFEDIFLQNRKIDDNNLQDNIIQTISELPYSDLEGSTIKYIKPLTIEELKRDDTNVDYFEQKLNNLLINSFKSVLENPDIYERVINPIDVKFLEQNIHALIPDIERENMGYFSSLEDAYTRLEYMEGKKGLGIIINQLMDSIRGSLLPTTINRSILPLGNNIMDKEYSEDLTEKELNYYFDFYNNYIEKYNKDNTDKKPKKKLTKSDLKKLKSLKLEESFTALVNGFVDIAKDPYVFKGNWNTTTTNLGAMLLRKGVHPFKVNNFLTNPIIKEYVDYINTMNSVSSTSRGNNFIKFLAEYKLKDNFDSTITVNGKDLDVSNILVDLIRHEGGFISELGLTGEEFSRLRINTFTSINKLKNNYIKSLVENNQFIKDNYNEFITELRKNAYALTRDLNKQYNKENKKVKTNLKKPFEFENTATISDLYVYDYLLDLSDKLNLSVKSNSYRVNGKSKNISSTIVAKNKVLKAASKTDYYNPFKNYDGRFENFNKDYKNNLKTTFENSIEFTLKIMKNNPSLFMSANPLAIRTFNLIGILSSDNGILTNQNLADSLERSYFSYIMSGFEPFIEKNPSDFIESFNKEFLKIKESGKFEKNALIKELDVVDNMIQTDGKKKLSHSVNNMVDGWNDLETSNPEFSKKLAKYSYLTSAFLTNPTTFFQYIPANFYNRNYFNNYIYKKVEEIKKNNTLNDGSFMPIDFNFIKQFAEHNFDNSYIMGKNKLIVKDKDDYYLSGNLTNLKIYNSRKEISPNNYVYNYDVNRKVSPKFIRDFVKVNEEYFLTDDINLTNIDYFKEEVVQEKPISNNIPKNNNSSQEIYNKLGNKTESGNVKIVDSIFKNKSNKNIITAFRVDKKLGLLESFNKFNAIGNPINWQDFKPRFDSDNATIAFMDWFLGNDFNNLEQEYRKEILNNIDKLKNKTIEYYKELGRPSHATALDYLINNNQETIEKSQNILERANKCIKKK